LIAAARGTAAKARGLVVSEQGFTGTGVAAAVDIHRGPPAMQKRLFAVLFAAAAAILAACGSSSTTPPVSKILTFKATLSGANETPPNSSTAQGTFTATLDTSTNTFTYTGTFTGLTNNVSAGHIHGPGSPGVAAGVIFNFSTIPGATFVTGSTGGTCSGSAVLSGSTPTTGMSIAPDSIRKLILAGLTYVNFHDSPTYGGGEIRGQLIQQ